MVQLILGLGSNQGNRAECLKKARGLIREQLGAILISSPLVESAPWGYDSKNWYLNQIVVLETIHSPRVLLDRIHEIEKSFGRVRTGEYADRQLDIDILLYGNQLIKTGELQIPHPRLTERRFVLMPLAEVLPNGVFPVNGKTYSELLAECRDQEECRWYTADN